MLRVWASDTRNNNYTRIDWKKHLGFSITIIFSFKREHWLSKYRLFKFGTFSFGQYHIGTLNFKIVFMFGFRFHLRFLDNGIRKNKNRKILLFFNPLYYERYLNKFKNTTTLYVLYSVRHVDKYNIIFSIYTLVHHGLQKRTREKHWINLHFFFFFLFLPSREMRLGRAGVGGNRV